MNLINLVTNTYPCDLYQVRQDNPNVSFSNTPTDEDLAPFGYANVHPTPQPEIDNRTQRIDGESYQEVEGRYYQQWSVRAATGEEISDYDLKHGPQPDWKSFATDAMTDEDVNSMLSTLLTQSPGLYGGIVVGLGQAGQGDPRMFTTSWAILMNTGLVSPSVMQTLQNLFTTYNIPA
jgi:hypothetical protein